MEATDDSLVNGKGGRSPTGRRRKVLGVPEKQRGRRPDISQKEEVRPGIASYDNRTQEMEE
jgi:hypothetical protein